MEVNIRKKVVFENEKRQGDDPVNHPSHYTRGNIECIDALTACTADMVGWRATLTWQVIKYMWRWPWKGNEVRDLEKAQFYLERLIKNVKAEEEMDVRHDIRAAGLILGVGELSRELVDNMTSVK